MPLVWFGTSVVREHVRRDRPPGSSRSRLRDRWLESVFSRMSSSPLHRHGGSQRNRAVTDLSLARCPLCGDTPGVWVRLKDQLVCRPCKEENAT